jgi:hypothetical protein
MRAPHCWAGWIDLDVLLLSIEPQLCVIVIVDPSITIITIIDTIFVAI